MSSLQEYLDQFQTYVQRQTTPISSIEEYPWVWSYQGSSDDPTHTGYSFHIGASVMIHGNEIGPLEGCLLYTSPSPRD